MSVRNVIIAAVLTKDVFRRFAQMSDDDKAKIVEKVKEKMNGNGKPAEEEIKDDVGSSDKATEMITENMKEAPEEEAPEAEASEEETTGIEDIVGDLIEEVETIKSDGQVSPSEVLGLIDNVVQMVQVLLDAKPGKAKKASREERIANRIVRRIAREDN